MRASVAGTDVANLAVGVVRPGLTTIAGLARPMLRVKNARVGEELIARAVLNPLRDLHQREVVAPQIVVPRHAIALVGLPRV